MRHSRQRNSKSKEVGAWGTRLGDYIATSLGHRAGEAEDKAGELYDRQFIEHLLGLRPKDTEAQG